MHIQTDDEIITNKLTVKYTLSTPIYAINNHPKQLINPQITIYAFLLEPKIGNESHNIPHIGLIILKLFRNSYHGSYDKPTKSPILLGET